MKNALLPQETNEVFHDSKVFNKFNAIHLSFIDTLLGLVTLPSAICRSSESDFILKKIDNKFFSEKFVLSLQRKHNIQICVQVLFMKDKVLSTYSEDDPLRKTIEYLQLSYKLTPKIKESFHNLLLLFCKQKIQDVYATPVQQKVLRKFCEGTSPSFFFGEKDVLASFKYRSLFRLEPKLASLFYQYHFLCFFSWLNRESNAHIMSKISDQFILLIDDLPKSATVIPIGSSILTSKLETM